MTRATGIHIGYSTSELIVYVTKDLVPNCKENGIFPKLLGTDICEQDFSKLRGAVSQAFTVMAMAQQRAAFALRQLYHYIDFFQNGWKMIYKNTMEKKRRALKRHRQGKHRPVGQLLSICRRGNSAWYFSDNNGANDHVTEADCVDDVDGDDVDGDDVDGDDDDDDDDDDGDDDDDDDDDDEGEEEEAGEPGSVNFIRIGRYRNNKARRSIFTQMASSK